MVAIPVHALTIDPPPYPLEETKPVLTRIRMSWQPGDQLYVYYGAAQAMNFYGQDSGFVREDYRIGGCHRGDPRAYLGELDDFRNGDFAINSHKVGEPPVYTACGNIPTKSESVTIALGAQNDSDQSGLATLTGSYYSP